MTKLLSRRTMLAAISAACPIAAMAADDAAPHWGYQGAEAPDHWGGLSDKFRKCGTGLRQSPIDLTKAIPAQPGTLTTIWRDTPGRVFNSGHDVEVFVDPGSETIIAGPRYELIRYHLHHPSEHTVDGRKYDMELHFVHRSAAGEFVVLGVLVRAGAFNKELEKVLSAMPHEAGPERPLPGTVRPAELLPHDRAYFRYNGSLTTPPCTEGVQWTVFRSPIEASGYQIKRYADLYPDIARPAQPLNRRLLLQSR